jgi:glycosyltransferase involved in cell wall biosynthesis
VQLDDLDLLAESARRMLPDAIDRESVDRAVHGALASAATKAQRPAVSDAFARDIDAALPGAGTVISCADRIGHDHPIDVLLGAHHLVVVDHPSTRLVVMGQEQPEGSHLVERLVVSTHLDTVWRTPPLTDERRNLVISRSSVLVALGESPSSWLAARAALALGTPVVLRDVAALALLAGDAAVVLPADIGPRHLAAAIERVVSDRPLAEALAARGRARVSETPVLDVMPAVLRAVHRDLVAGSGR